MNDLFISQKEQHNNIRHTSHLKTQSVNIVHHGQESILFLSAKI